MQVDDTPRDTKPMSQAHESPPMKAHPSLPARKPGLLQRLTQHEDLNFLLTNRVPRQALTHLVGWYSRIRSPWHCRSCGGAPCAATTGRAGACAATVAALYTES